MSLPPVVHLHNHTTYSVRDGLQKLAPMCAAAAADGQPAIAITDHGTLAGGWQLGAEARKVGIKPILGAELYLAYGSRLDHDGGEGLDDFGRRGKTKSNQHLTVLAKNSTGWHNLVSLMRETHETVWHKPRADMELLSRYAAGLVVLTGCLGGPVAGALAIGEPDLADSNLAVLVDIFGREDLYVEVMSHGIVTEDRIMAPLIGLAKRHGLGVVATNDAHYTSPADSDTHKAWLCAGQPGVTLSTPAPPRWEFPGGGYHLRSTREMRAIFDDQPGTERAVTTSWEIAERIEADVLPERRSRLPRMPLPSGQTAAAALWALVKDGAKRRYGDPPSSEVQERLRHEMRVIAGASLSDYFLVVADLTRWATERGIRTSVRGSAVGCAVAYCTGITSIDPMAYGLLFERFLNPDRAGLPDIDIDCERDRQAELIAYLAMRWGQDHVARLGTLALERSRSSIRSVGRALGLEDVADELARLVPSGPGGQPIPLDAVMADDTPVTEPFRSKVEESEAARRVVQMAESFAGVVSLQGVHACGVVVSSEPLVGCVPLRKHSATGQVVTEWDGHDIEDVGLLKLDLLRLRTLDVVTNSIKLIEQSTGEVVDPAGVSDDPASDVRSRAAWDLIASGDTAGLFQLDSQGMTKLVTEVRPRSIADLAVVIALYRPGPLGQRLHDRYALRRHGREAVDYGYLTSDPAEVDVLRRALGETYGVAIYQEQIMALGDVVAGFGPGARNRLQKAVSKKDRQEMAEVGRLFREGATSDHDDSGAPKQVFRHDTASRVWATVAAAGSYAFNKSHAVAYAAVAFQSAYLAANWPAAFGASLLASTDRDDKRFSALVSLRAKGIAVLPPSVNAGNPGTVVEDESTIRLGLGEVLGVGSKAALIGAAAPYADLADVVKRSGAPINAIEALIQAGACDDYGPRLGQMAVVRGLKSSPDLVIPDIEWGVVERAARERHVLRTLLSESPLVSLAPRLTGWRHQHERIPLHGQIQAGRRYTVVGIVASIELIQRSYRLARLVLEGTKATRECVIWGDLLGRLEAEHRVPAVGQVIQADVVAKVRQVERSADDGDGEDDQEVIAEPQITLTVHRVYSAAEVRQPNAART